MAAHLGCAVALWGTALGAGEVRLPPQVEALAARGKFAAAVALLRTAEKREAASAELRVGEARVLRDAGYYFLDNGLFTDALKAGQAALAIDPDHPAALYEAAALLYDGGRFAESVVLFERLAQLPEAQSFPALPAYRRAAPQLAELQDRKENKEEEAAADRCDLCWRPLGAAVVQLDDGRRRCSSCAAGAIHDDGDLVAIRETVTTFLESGLGLHLPKKVTGHLVSKDEMRRLAAERLSSFTGVTSEDLAGLFAPYPDRLAVYVLRGLPRVETQRVLAHEMAHAWEAQQCPLELSIGAKEGFAEWVAYRTLVADGHTEEAAWMFLEPGPYGVHFKRFEVIGRVLGTEQTIRQMQEGRF